MKQSTRGALWAARTIVGGSLCGFLAFALMHGGCRQAPPQQKSAQQAQATPQKSLEPIDAGGGVYYFPLVGNDYRAALGKFLLEHPELKCRYFGADDALDTAGFGAPTAYAHIVGHTVVCTPIGKYAQDDTRE